MVESIAYNSFAVPVRVEVDGPGRNNADQVGSQPFEQGSPPFNLMDGEKDLEGFSEVKYCALRYGERRDGRNASGISGRDNLSLVEI